MIENQAHVVSDIDGKFGGGFGEPFQVGIVAFQDVDIRPKCRGGSEDFDDCLLTAQRKTGPMTWERSSATATDRRPQRRRRAAAPDVQAGCGRSVIGGHLSVWG